MSRREDLEEARSDLINARGLLARHNLSELELRADTLVKVLEVELTRMRDEDARRETASAP